MGFARRFATYKRANLILRDIEAHRGAGRTTRRRRSSWSSPVKLIHRIDRARSMLQQVARLMRDPRFAGKVVFIEDYDINVGRHLVQGVDCWMNNPRRPLEACGTSGQKVVLNGGLNLSILDGWWAEAYDGLNGFAIGSGETHTSIQLHDFRDGEALFKVLRDEVIPLYYERDQDGLPRRMDCTHEARNPHAWLALQRRSDGDGLRAQRLHSSGRRHELRHESVLVVCIG